MRNPMRVLVTVFVAIAAIAAVAFMAVRYMDVIQRQFELFRELIARRHNRNRSAEDELAMDESSVPFDDYSPDDEALPDMTF